MRAVRVGATAAVVGAVVVSACIQLNVTAMAFYESGSFFALAGALLYVALRCPGWWGSALSLALTGALFGLRLVAMWRMDTVNPHLVGGLLPYSDASQYYTEALRLLDFGYFSWATVNAGRPIWPGAIATLLSVTGGDLQIAHALLTGIVAYAVYRFAREAQLSFGAGTGTIALLTLYLFYVQFIGNTSSEALGLALGAVAAGVLMRAVRDRSRIVFWLGLFLLVLALQARPGAFFVLPALMLWGAWSFGNERRYRVAFIAGCSAAVLGGFAIQWLFMTFLVDPAAPPAFTKIGLQAWSLAVGRSPDDIYLVHPEARGLLPQQLNPLILDWAWTAFWAHPLSVIRDAVRVTLSFFYVYGALVDYIHVPLSAAAVIIKLNLLGWVGLVVRYRSARHGMVAAAIVGIIASAPMTAYVGSRSNAATMPLMIIPAALAASWIMGSLDPFRWIRLTAALKRPRYRRRLAFPVGMALVNLAVLVACVSGWAKEQAFSYEGMLYASLLIVGAISFAKFGWLRGPKEFHAPQATLIYGLTLASLVIIGPFAIKVSHRALSLPDTRCPADEVSAYLRVNPGSVVNLVDDSRLSQTRAPNVRNSDYLKPWGGTRENLPPSFEKELLNIEAEHTILQGVDLRTSGASGILWLNVPTTLLPKGPGIVRFCSPPTRYGMFTPSSAEMVSQGS